ncbi:MAG: hypothetical protein QOE63_1097, partial [Acidimicrobiaceae bacterium]
QCGAQNRGAAVCRICGQALPDLQSGEGPLFIDLVEEELRSWYTMSGKPVSLLSPLHAEPAVDRRDPA